MCCIFRNYFKISNLLENSPAIINELQMKKKKYTEHLFRPFVVNSENGQ